MLGAAQTGDGAAFLGITLRHCGTDPPLVRVEQIEGHGLTA